MKTTYFEEQWEEQLKQPVISDVTRTRHNKPLGQVVWRSILSKFGGFPFKRETFTEAGESYRLHSSFYERTNNKEV